MGKIIEIEFSRVDEDHTLVVSVERGQITSTRVTKNPPTLAELFGLLDAMKERNDDERN